MATEKKKRSRGKSPMIDWPFGMKNYVVFAIAIVVIVVGYVLLGQGSMTAAPVLLVLGYCVLIPVAILIRGTSDNGEGAESSESVESVQADA